MSQESESLGREIDPQRRRYRATTSAPGVTAHRESVSPTAVPKISERPPSEELWRIQLPRALHGMTRVMLSVVQHNILVVHGERNSGGFRQDQAAWCLVF